MLGRIEQFILTYKAEPSTIYAIDYLLFTLFFCTFERADEMFSGLAPDGRENLKLRTIKKNIWIL